MNDLISRSEILKKSRGFQYGHDLSYVIIQAVPVSVIESAPAIDPEDLRPKGRWEPNRPGKTNTRTIYRCSKCGHSNGRYFNDKFCRGCGAKMTEEA